MPHLYREMSLYNMHGDFLLTQTPGGKHDYFTLKSGGRAINMSHTEEVSVHGLTKELIIELAWPRIRWTES